jgi:hypothetical protein
MRFAGRLRHRHRPDLITAGFPHHGGARIEAVEMIQAALGLLLIIYLTGNTDSVADRRAPVVEKPIAISVQTAARAALGIAAAVSARGWVVEKPFLAAKDSVTSRLARRTSAYAAQDEVRRIHLCERCDNPARQALLIDPRCRVDRVSRYDPGLLTTAWPKHRAKPSTASPGQPLQGTSGASVAAYGSRCSDSE